MKQLIALIPKLLIPSQVPNVEYSTFEIEGLDRPDIRIARVGDMEFTVIVETNPNVWFRVGDIPSKYNDSKSPPGCWGADIIRDTTLEQWIEQCREYYKTFVVSYTTPAPVRKPNPNESFAITSITREQVASNLNYIIEEDNLDIALFEKDDIRLTSNICQELANEFRYIDRQDNEEDQVMEEHNLTRQLIERHFVPTKS